MQPPTRGRTTGRTYWYIVSILSCQNISNSTGYLTDKELKDAPSPSAFNTNVPPLDNYTTGSPCVRNGKHFLAWRKIRTLFVCFHFISFLILPPFVFLHFHSLYSIPFHSIPLHCMYFSSIPIHSISFYSIYSIFQLYFLFRFPPFPLPP